jgi:hypothetical protein
MKRFGAKTHYWIGGVVDLVPSRVRKLIRRERLIMFARKVAARLKPNSLTEFTNLMEREILPWLRKQEGFLDLITLAAPDGTEVAAISFWDREGDARAFDSDGYPEALKILGRLLDGIPYVKTFDVLSSTLQRVALGSLPGTESLAQKPDSAKGVFRARERRVDAAPIGVRADSERNRQFMTVTSEYRQQR